MKLRLALALLGTIVASSPALAGVDSCEKIKDADAYNACLASYGPAAGAHPTIRAPDRADVLRPRRKGAKPEARTTAPPNHGPQITRKANGRVRMEILVPSGR
ncbi:hypothetical protein [uncultured Rhodoblastus sp.]|uniref:hypothetical protein n=1 Tax=uncultured Rhodoblastus sp. TaxID=543037 RepID=UPI0025DC2A0F|nr:hypothetical protein [uncultured Rhodoblastus sp.]